MFHALLEVASFLRLCLQLVTVDANTIGTSSLQVLLRVSCVCAGSLLT